jgi:diguanylate cyclase (GGDEF)-like protein
VLGGKGRGPSVFATPDESRAAVRAGGALALALSAVGAVLVLGVSAWAAPDSALLLLLLGLVAAVGAFSLRLPERVPGRWVVGNLVIGTALVSAGMVLVGRAAVDSADNEVLYLVPVLYAAYFCRPWVAATVTATATGTYGAALVLVGTPAAARWLTTSAVLTLTATTVSLMRRRDASRILDATAEAGRDPLTGLLNRRGLAALGAELPRSGPVSLLLVDVDHFKQINDRHGHEVGDTVLVRLAAALQEQAHPGDLVARLGGEEFTLVLPGCDSADARDRAERLRRQVGDLSAAWPSPLTLSVGTATSSGVLQLPELLCAADRGLYAAKAAGRNTVRTA